MPGKESRVYICVDDTSREEKIAHLRGETAIPRGSSTVREHSEHMEKDGDSNCFQVQRYPQTAPDECENSHTRNQQEVSCVSDSMPGL